MSNQKELFDALYFMSPAELKKICEKYSLPTNGMKGDIINRLKHFFETGKILLLPKIPAHAKAQPGKTYPLSAQTLILKGAYKNDLKTRLFFKKLIGPHFHFTAFGLDWIRQRWLAGKPPTYQQFADFWHNENQRRKKENVQPKQEWAYLSFIQRYLAKHPNAKRAEIAKKWKEERKIQTAKVLKLLP